MVRYRAGKRILITVMMTAAIDGLASTAMAATVPAHVPSHALACPFLDTAARCGLIPVQYTVA
jgi:hypothetical protein